VQSYEKEEHVENSVQTLADIKTLSVGQKDTEKQKQCNPEREHRVKNNDN